jgi:hypothetical protein
MTSSDVTGSPKAISSDVTGSLDIGVILLGHARPIHTYSGLEDD